ncbi:conserved hypothetical protein [Theileria orientalis strain Shintoku]|uniref:Uncharacterized protein n=1 Tax=Theileria orientalis strain Shintoku TaxID=869250 RepID=J4DNH0_THEOR|nr:conserved hypothetical protein [Theileria orientalis strain Shintoku]BAM38944.1 conserved hypothetical protein [Theileria orientalis strain Shintoku]|eukprot:XP_009689245.1 conserved hypothetical protein [Theileria orientalis strain Shintoku]
MVFFKKSSKQEETAPSVFLGEYNMEGLPFHHYADANDLSLTNGNIIKDLHRAIILKPITREKIVEVMKEEVEEKVVYVPRVQVVDRYVEVIKPVIKYKVKEVKRPVTVEKIKKVAKIIEEEKIVEVPEIQYVEKYVDVPTIVKKEKIIEIPIPMVCERRIPVLNINKKERLQELDSVEFRSLNHGSSLFGSSSIDEESSVHTSAYSVERTEQCVSDDKSVVLDVSEGQELIRYSEVSVQTQTVDDHQKSDKLTLMEVYTEFKQKESARDNSKLRYFDSKSANYNSSEGEKQVLEELSEISSYRYTENDTHEHFEENKIEITYGLKEKYPSIHKLSITDETCDSKEDHTEESNLGRSEETTRQKAKDHREDQARKSRFESRVLLSPELEEKTSKKSVEKESTQATPTSLKIIDRIRRLKMDNK